MKKFIPVSIAALFFLLTISGKKSFASHAQGMELTYRCLGGNNYTFTLYFYRDCSGIPAPTSFIMDVSSATCGFFNTITLFQVGPASEISSLCPSATSTCQGGANPGVEQYMYQNTVALGNYCPDWIFSVSECCRNSMITNLLNASSYDLYVESKLDNSDTICNSSPAFSVLPVPYICINQLSNYNFGAYDTDGDSLVFNLINPLDGVGSPVPYNTPYSPDYPITTTTGSVQFDSTTGNLSFTPDANQVCAITVLVQEYRNNILIGSIMRDIQVLILNCGTNSPPYLTNNTFYNLSGGIMLDNNSILMCVGTQLTFEMDFNDNDTTDSLLVTSNILLAIPAAIFDTTGINPVIGSFSWTSDSSDAGFRTFIVTVKDNNCPIKGEQTYSFDIYVNQGMYAGPDFYLCGTDTAQLQATGNGNFIWTPSAGLSDDTIANPLAYPASTTTYTVMSDCGNSDSVTVFIGADFSLSISQSDSLVCAGESLILTAQPTPAGTYTYTWLNSPWLSALNVQNPAATPPDTAIFTVNVISADGCLKTASIVVNVNDDPITINPTASDDLICKGSSTELFANASSSLPYTLQWYDSQNNLVGTNDSFMVAPVSAETYTLNAYSYGCSDSNSVSIEVVSILAGNDTAVCIGSAVQLSTFYYGPVSFTPSVCGTSVGCFGIGGISDYIAGTGITTNTNTTWPAPYGNWYKNARHQFLFTASELNALGVTGGTITALAFNVTQIDGTTDYYSYTIKMGCTNITSLTTWQSGLTTVYNPKTHTVVVGWNNHPLDVPYDWDGISNIIVDICYDNLSQPNYTYNSLSPYSITGFTSCIYEYSDVTPMCPSTNIPTATNNRSNTRFTVCTDALSSTYSWNPTTGLDYPDSANPVATITTSTTYIVTMDNGLCTMADTVTVNVYSAFTLSTTSVPSSCGLSDGSATVTPTGGTPPFTYQWNDPGNQSTSTATGLSSGSYTISVSDAGGCFVTALAAVSDNGAPVVTISGVTNTSCPGNTDGSATVNASGGTPPYSYQWDAQAGGQTASAATGLAAGTYAVTVNDNSSCAAVVTAAVGNNPPPAVSVSASVNISCYGGNNGQVTVAVTGGTPPYYYLWNTTPAQTSSAATGLAAGTYNVTVTDSKGCTGATGQSLTQPVALSSSFSVINASCGTNDGSAAANVVGGVQPYTFSWNDPSSQTTSSATGLYAGSYSVTITDTKGCSLTANTTVNNVGAPTVAITVTDVTACGNADGTAAATASGGNPPYSYTWSTGSQTTQTATGLAGGSYLVTVIDNAGCAVIGTATVNEPVSISSYPYVENFDSFNSAPYNVGSPGPPIIPLANGWENDQADGGQDWAPRSTPTQSPNTGPDYDHTYGNDSNTAQGNYIFVEDNYDNDPVILLSPCFDLSPLGSAYLGFWYHSYNGVDTTQKSYIHVDIFTGGSWINDITPAIGPTVPNEWKYRLKSLSAYSGIIKIRFRGDVSNSINTHDIAIDDFTIYDSLITIGRVNTDFFDCRIYPNPVNEKLTVEVTNVSQSGEVQFSLCDVFGREIHRQRIADNKYEMNVKIFPPGIYFYRISVTERVMNYGKIILK